METYIYEVRSAKGVHIEQLNKELSILIYDYDSTGYPTQTKLTSYASNIILTTTNHKLVDALIKDMDFIVTEIK